MEEIMAKGNNQSAEVAELKKQCDDCCKKIAALKKEVAELKKELSSAKGGADPRVDNVIEFLRKHWKNRTENYGL
jgi:uncharacterized coiled-coil DUF342 family protein